MPPAGAAARELREAIAFKAYEFNAHGVDLNQRYASGAIVPDGTPDPGFARDPELHHQPSSRPGARLPHAWITSGSRTLSTLDTVGRGRFTLLTGIGGEDWLRAASAQDLPVATVVIGPGQEYEDRTATGRA
ncbi:2,4-dichlorophenol 6-monooxygenase OS=Streptomyces violarus OX=67380 GN=FHS41_001172 PE=4 SV=1 [Streptomyces violarus]